ncbi:MAG: RNA-binding protein [Candidatus Omnitrophota bacterium]
MEESRLYVGNLKYSVTGEELQGLFSEYGEVKDVVVMQGKGFAFVEMAESEAAEKAKEALNGQDFQGRILRIDAARPRRERERGGRDRGFQNR